MFTITEMKNIPQGINSRLEEQISDLKDKVLPMGTAKRKKNPKK